MFLFSLIIFPLIAYWIFNIYKADVKQVNGAVKLIGVIGIFIFITLISTEIFRHKDSYLALLFIWYFIVFIYFYIIHLKKIYQALNTLTFPRSQISSIFLNIFYVIIIFIFYMGMINNDYVNDKLGIFHYDSNPVLDTLFLFFINMILYGLIYHFMDAIKNFIFKRILDKRKFREEVKAEVKAEILEELKNS